MLPPPVDFKIRLRTKQYGAHQSNQSSGKYPCGVAPPGTPCQLTRMCVYIVVSGEDGRGVASQRVTCAQRCKSAATYLAFSAQLAVLDSGGSPAKSRSYNPLTNASSRTGRPGVAVAAVLPAEEGKQTPTEINELSYLTTQHLLTFCSSFASPLR